MTRKLLLQALIKFFSGLIIVGLLLFLSAGSFKFYNAWLFIGLLFIPMFIAGIILMFVNPDLLKRRLEAKEKEKAQKGVILGSAIMFLAGFIIAGLNYRYSWTSISNTIVIISSILFLISYIIYGEVLRENAYLYRTIKVDKKQKLVDTGLYGIVRHPMYFATIILFLTIPLILNSIISFIIFLVYPILIIIRINNEERVLLKELKGYTEYKKKVKYKLIPFIW